MTTGTDMGIVEQVRSQKEAVAARHDFDVARIISAARVRQESSRRRIIRQGEPVRTRGESEGGEVSQRVAED
jgi:hypothetical protein